MNSLTWNVIEVNLLIFILFLGFQGVKKQVAYRHQRILLYGIPLISVVIVSIKSAFDFSSVAYSLPILELDPVVVYGNTIHNEAVSNGFSLNVVYWGGAMIAFALLMYRLVKINRLFRKRPYVKQDKFRIYQVQELESFSFFNRIQLSPILSGTDQQLVLEHEKIHAIRRHSIDLLYAEILHALFWFNPVFFFFKRAFVNLHEFEVDAEMYKRHKVGYMRFLVNYALRLSPSTYLLTSSFYNQLTLKKRIMNMKTKNTKRTWLLALIPIIGLSALFFQCTKSATPVDEDQTRIESEPTAEIPQEQIYDEVDIAPEFNGGQEGMSAYLVDNIQYPEIAKENGESGTVFVQFVVAANGKVKDAHVARGVSESLDQEALRVVSSMPNWKPGQLGGENVAVKFTLPINYRLD